MLYFSKPWFRCGLMIQAAPQIAAEADRFRARLKELLAGEA